MDKNIQKISSKSVEYIKSFNLQKIERRLLEIEEEKPRRIHNASENYSESWEDEIERLISPILT